MKSYFFRFGFGDPRTYTGMAPTLLVFAKSDGTGVTPPSITEVSTSGIYTFAWGTTQPIAFLADAATTSPGSTGRYVSGSLDPADRADEYGATMVALGNTAVAASVAVGIGTNASSYGSAATMPTDIFGYMKRIQENLEGNQTFVKATGVLSIYSIGSSQLFATKTITNSASAVIKT